LLLLVALLDLLLKQFLVLVLAVLLTLHRMSVELDETSQKHDLLLLQSKLREL